MTEQELGEITGGWDYSSVPHGVHIGKGCHFERKESFERFRSMRDPGLLIGDRVRVYTWTTFNVEPTGFIEIGDDSILVGPVFMCAEYIRIGRRVIISYNVTIADSDFHPRDPEERKRDAIANAPLGDRKDRPALVTQPVTIEDDVWIGIGAIILKGVTIGKGARIGAGAVITRDVPSGMTLVGNPAQAAPPGATT